MQVNQQPSKVKIVSRASRQQRIIGGLVLLALVCLFVVLWLGSADIIDMGWWFGPCGFKQRYGLPCPTCGMITSALAFVQGKIFEAFYIQPAAALMCCILAVTALFAFLMAVPGVYFSFLKRFCKVKVRHVILALLVIIAAGWAVTLARALASN